MSLAGVCCLNGLHFFHCWSSFATTVGLRRYRPPSPCTTSGGLLGCPPAHVITTALHHSTLTHWHYRSHDIVEKFFGVLQGMGDWPTGSRRRPPCKHHRSKTPGLHRIVSHLASGGHSRLLEIKGTVLHRRAPLWSLVLSAATCALKVTHTCVCASRCAAVGYHWQYAFAGVGGRAFA